MSTPLQPDEILTPLQPEPPVPTPPPTISLSDIMNAVAVLQQKETADKTILDAIGGATFESLRPMLVTWATLGLPNAYTLMELAVAPPAQCSDSVVREIGDYITFCSGKTIDEHVALLQEKLTDIRVSYANLGYAIAIVVSKA